ncbi:hypothetical protein NC652_002110 [Populus alba x Populus x berolinensis]|nr:hypothetical protein NC652_002110 [Populus alba x Populus x berolinensis]
MEKTSQRRKPTMARGSDRPPSSTVKNPRMHLQNPQNTLAMKSEQRDTFPKISVEAQGRGRMTARPPKRVRELATCVLYVFSKKWNSNSFQQSRS